MCSDHRLVRSLVALELPPPRRRQAVRRRKLNVSKLREEDMHQELQESISQRLQHPEQQTANSVEEQWTRIKEATYEASSETLGFATSKHKDWFDDLLSWVYGPREAGSAPVKSLDGVTLTDRTKILERWKEHFETVLNQSSSFDMNVLSEIPQWPLASRLDEVPTRAEIQKAINQMSNGKAPGTDGIPAEVFKKCSSAFYYI